MSRPRSRNSQEPTKRPSRRQGPVNLTIADIRHVLISKGMQADLWDMELEAYFADLCRRWWDDGARGGSETNKVRQLRDEIDDKDRRIVALELELKQTTKLYNEARGKKQVRPTGTAGVVETVDKRHGDKREE